MECYQIYGNHVWLRSTNSSPAITMSPSSYSSSHQPPLMCKLSVCLCLFVCLSVGQYIHICQGQWTLHVHVCVIVSLSFSLSPLPGWQWGRICCSVRKAVRQWLTQAPPTSQAPPPLCLYWWKPLEPQNWQREGYVHLRATDCIFIA